ncbi:MAG: nitroreductase family protein [Arachnia sp.]
MPDSFTDLVRARRTVRDFRAEAVDAPTLAAILDDARHAPSWSNTRPYRLAVATGDQLERLRLAYAREFDATLGIQHRNWSATVKAVLTGRLPDADFPTWRRYPEDLRRGSVAVGKALYRHLGIQRGDRAARDAHTRRNCELFGAPVGIWLFVHRKLLPFSAHDAGLMLQTLMLSAAARGVDSCALGILASWRRPIDAEFEVPADYQLITGLALGYASGEPVNTFRAEHPPVGLLPARS